jgi:hypothetical protein
MKPLAVGINGQTSKGNPPTLYNAYQHLLPRWTRVYAEDQIISPLTNRVEMGNPLLATS